MPIPTTINELLWYGFGIFASYFLWSIKMELSNIRKDLTAENTARNNIEKEIAAINARCDERHKVTV